MLTPAAQEAVDLELAAIENNHLTSIRLRIENGQHALNIKALVGHGSWIQTIIDGNVGYSSPRTIQRDMALATSLYKNLDKFDKLSSFTSVTALRELCNPSAPEEALNVAVSWMESGLKVTGKIAEKLTHVFSVSKELGIQVQEGNITLDDGYALSECWEGVWPIVRGLVLDNNIRSKEVVLALNTMHQKQPDQFNQVLSSGAVYNPVTQEDTPLSDVSKNDLMAAMNTEETEKFLRHQQHIEDWRNGKSKRVAKVTGCLGEVLRQLNELPDDGEYIITVYKSVQEHVAV